MVDKRKVVVIGGGPGGYVAAIRAAQLGAQVTLVEKEKLGGTCLNVGCIPTKVLLHTVELYNQLKEAGSMGLKVDKFEIDWTALMKRKEGVIKQLVNGVRGLLLSNGVRIVEGTASFVSRSAIEIDMRSGEKEKLDADAFIIATGSVTFVPPIEGVDLPGVVTSTEALAFERIPKSMAIIGGGVIGVELASVYSSLGCDVAIVEMMPRIIPNMDEELAGMLQNILSRKGVKIFTGAKVTSISRNESGLGVSISAKEGEITVTSEKVLVSVGRKPYTEGLNLEGIGVKLEKGRVAVDERMRTNIENIFAIGDCTGKVMLAHVASSQGVVAAENIMGHDSLMDYKTTPGCIYTQPEMAGVGLTEQEAREKGYDLKVGRFPLVANGKSLIMNDTEGMVKVIADKKYDEILGVHILGPRATDLIVEGALALRLEATLEEIATTIHAHPTVGEAVLEAALAADGIAVHIPNKKG